MTSEFSKKQRTKSCSFRGSVRCYPGLAWLPPKDHGYTPEQALGLFLDLLKRILFAKNKHASDTDTLGAQKDSGKCRGHSFRGTERGRLREKRQDALKRAMRSNRLSLQMDDAMALDQASGKHWRRNSDSIAFELWAGWTHWHRQDWLEHGAIVEEYQSIKQEYAFRFDTHVAKRFRVG